MPLFQRHFVFFFLLLVYRLSDFHVTSTFFSDFLFVVFDSIHQLPPAESRFFDKGSRVGFQCFCDELLTYRGIGSLTFACSRPKLRVSVRQAFLSAFYSALWNSRRPREDKLNFAYFAGLGIRRTYNYGYTQIQKVHDVI